MRSWLLFVAVVVALGGCRSTPERSVVLAEPSGLMLVTILAKGLE